ncbi:hypothetical protein Glove_261g46 [Diversispora epigaea]|uniref:Uncharacterized protein n=1 Tax=Diversispora epigaea TaxID=1348612 RepID=A0A397I6I3_9GLOM|nr:hypothetical protein Glove_261g46 [Diversispora epigaea]
MVGKCPGCGWSLKTEKTRDLNKHMDLTRKRPYLTLLQLSCNTQPITNLNFQSQDPNARKSGESVKQWGSRLRKRVKELSDKNRGQPKKMTEIKALYNELLQLDPNAYFRPATEKELREEQGFFDQPEIEEANFQHKSYPMTTPLNNIELQPVQELLNRKDGFLDLNIEVPWPVPFPNDKEHCAIWQNGIQTAKDMFKVDGAEYAFSTWFTTAKEIELVSVILGAKNENELMQAVFLECLYHNYLEEEINENMEIAVDAYRVSDKGSKAWLYVLPKSQII